MKVLLSGLLAFGVAAQAKATELNPRTIVGNYKVSANVAFQKVYLNFHVLGTDSFEVQRVYPSGQQDEVCAGRYTMTSAVFKGVFFCPSKPNKQVDFDINFRNKTTEDLLQGTTVAVKISLAPGMPINAFVKKNP